MKVFIKSMEYDFIIDTDKIIAFEKISDSKVYDNKVYYNAYTIDGKSFKISEKVYNTYMNDKTIIDENTEE